MAGLTRRTLLAAGATLAAAGPGALATAAARAASSGFAGRALAAGWPRNGHDLQNSSFSSGEKFIGTGNVGRLGLKWRTAPTGPIQNSPTVAGGTLYFGTWDHEVVAVDAASGERRWKLSPPGNTGLPAHEQGIRGSVQVHGERLYFTDSLTRVHCVETGTGRIIWQKQLDAQAEAHMAHARFSPAVVGNRVIVAHGGLQPQIACLDAGSGTINWRFYTGQGGTPWTSAAVDEARGVVYNVTGDPKSIRAGDPMLYSNCMLANDLATGELRWFRQVQSQDSNNLDFSCHPMLFSAGGPLGAVRECVGAGNKKGFNTWDRATGEPLWRTALTAPHQAGGPLADSTAAAYNRIYLTSNASSAGRPITLVAAALDAYSGEIDWWTHHEAMVASGVVVANGIFYFGQADGRLKALDAGSGATLWEHRLPSAIRGIALADGVLYAAHGEVYVVPGRGLEGGYSVHAFGVTA